MERLMPATGSFFTVFFLLFPHPGRRPTEHPMSNTTAPSWWLVAYVRHLRRYRYLVLLFWLLCFVFGCWQGFKLLQVVTISIQPPDGSRAEEAVNQFTALFPAEAHSTELVVLLQSVDGSSVLTPSTEAFTLALNKSLCEYSPPYVAAADFESYYTLPLQNLGILAQQTVAADNLSTIILISAHIAVPLETQPQDLDFSDFARDTVQSLADQFLDSSKISARITGMLLFARDVQTGSEHDLLVMDGIAFPVAMLVLGVVLRSVRLLVFPILNMAVSITTSYLVVYLISFRMSIISFAPSLMASISVAVGVDYSLFLLSRYREELKRGATPFDSVVSMLRYSGHTVLVSGCTLMVCFLGLLFFPNVVFRSPGLGAALAIFITIASNLSLTPALLLLFDKFFAHCIVPFNWRTCRSASAQIVSALNDGDDISDSHTLLQSSAEHSPYAFDDLLGDFRLRRTAWFRFGRAVTRFPWLVAIVVLGLAVPCAIRAVNFHRSVSVEAFTPRSAAATTAYEDLSRDFGAGTIAPYYLIIVPPAGMKVLSDEFYRQAQADMEKLLVNLPGTTVVASAFAVDLGGQAIDLDFNSTVAPCLANVTVSPLCPAIVKACHDFVNPDNAAALAQLTVNLGYMVDIEGPLGVQWLLQMRANIDALPSGSFKYYLSGGATAAHDTQEKVYGIFPMAVGVTAAMVCILIGIAFRSVVVPLRSILTIFTTLAIVYGCAVWVYEDGALDWMHWQGVRSLGSLVWITPVLAFSIVVGLSLDYDTFLLTRIFEFRRSGMDDKRSILFGLTHTGWIISFAGLIMAVAFGGLLFSSETVLNQLSFFLTFAVLIDTLVIRTILVPALMTMLGRANWWPAHMPQQGEALLMNSAEFS
eukprot:m.110734 g.110734  ORF g.110734 m.110734 type:complete len:873 (+) comp19202_c0_seq2:701-3319(+)